MPIINVDDLMELSDLFTVVEEPEYSKRKLLSYQEKYGMPSDVFYNYYTQMLGFAKVLNNEEFDDWAYNYEIFLEAGGDIWELKYEENGFPSGLRQPGPLGRLEGEIKQEWGA